jgi:hypothetical protein
MNIWIGVVFLTLSLAITLGSLLYDGFFNQAPIVFESLQSKTKSGMPVFNRIQFLPGWEQDIWLMQQSHDGLDMNYVHWDRLAIVVDKTKSPCEAAFYQLAPG